MPDASACHPKKIVAAALGAALTLGGPGASAARAAASAALRGPAASGRASALLPALSAPMASRDPGLEPASAPAGEALRPADVGAAPADPVEQAPRTEALLAAPAARVAAEEPLPEEPAPAAGELPVGAAFRPAAQAAREAGASTAEVTGDRARADLQAGLAAGNVLYHEGGRARAAEEPVVLGSLAVAAPRSGLTPVAARREAPVRSAAAVVAAPLLAGTADFSPQSGWLGFAAALLLGALALVYRLRPSRRNAAPEQAAEAPAPKQPSLARTLRRKAAGITRIEYGPPASEPGAPRPVTVYFKSAQALLASFAEEYTFAGPHDGRYYLQLDRRFALDFVVDPKGDTKRRRDAFAAYAAKFPGQERVEFHETGAGAARAAIYFKDLASMDAAARSEDFVYVEREVASVGGDRPYRFHMKDDRFPFFVYFDYASHSPRRR